jgi:AcrR family transcriptional regulator
MIQQRDQPPSVRQPQQKRSERSLARVLKATEKLLNDHHFDDLSVDVIAQAAKVSIGSFYARFGGKEALLPLLYERYRQTMDLADRSLEECTAATLDGLVETIIASQVTRFRTHRGLLRTLAFRERNQIHNTDNQMVRWAKLATRRRAAAFQKFANEIEHPDPAAAIEYGLFFAMSALREKILFEHSPHARITRLSDRKLISELSHMLTSYLRAPRGQSQFAALHSSCQPRRNPERHRP